MAGLFPGLEPTAIGMLDVGDSQRIYWEECGSPSGVPVVVLHGGPGSGCTPGLRRFFDPERYRVILLDQRGAGRSQPRVDAFSDLQHNTTQNLIKDLEHLRAHLDVDRWVVFGVSWGTTLGLVYAETHPDRVSAMVLSSVTMTRSKEIHWLYHETGRFYPEQWQRFRAGADSDGDLVTAYHHLLHEHPESAVREQAALDWCAWEDAASPMPDGRSNPRYDDPRFRMTFARIVTHYFHHRAWLTDDQLLNDAHRLSGVPGVLIHGRLDLGGPIETAWELSQTWPDAQLVIVDAGHSGGDPMTNAIIEALSRFASAR